MEESLFKGKVHLEYVQLLVFTLFTTVASFSAFEQTSTPFLCLINYVRNKFFINE